MGQGRRQDAGEGSQDPRAARSLRETYRHEYPYCWRSDDDPLIQYAREAWFIRTTAKIDQVIDNNQKVIWAPEHVRDGRFGDFLAGNVDWALSRERFWGTPLNVWECASCGHAVAPESCAAIEARNPSAFAAFAEARAKDPSLSEHLIVHKPWIDEVTFPCDECGAAMRRVPEVIDCWFDSGCMPFAQLGYPHLPDSKEAFERAFPADFISEAIDQTRGWFYSLMMISKPRLRADRTGASVQALHRAGAGPRQAGAEGVEEQGQLHAAGGHPRRGADAVRARRPRRALRPMG